jgi:hypothetical protein
MQQPSVRSVDNLGIFQKQYRGKRRLVIGRLIFFVSLGLFIISLLPVLTGLFARLVFENFAWLGLFLPVLTISGMITVIGLYLFVKSLVVVAPTAVAVYEEGLVYVTILNAKPQVVRWKQVAKTWVVRGSTSRMVRYGPQDTWQREYVETDWLVKLDTGRPISFGPLQDGGDLLRRVESHVKR